MVSGIRKRFAFARFEREEVVLFSHASAMFSHIQQAETDV